MSSHRPSADAVKLSLIYGALFTVVGVQMPFWPVWLELKGMSPSQIGILLGAIYWAKVVSNPLVAHMVDAGAGRRRMMIVLAVASAVLYPIYLVTDNFWGLLALSLFAGSLLPGLMPLTETVTMTLTTQGRLDYGRVRLWGSLSFILAAQGTGLLVDQIGPKIVLWLVMLGVGLVLASVFTVPDPPTHGRTGPRLKVSILLKDRTYVLFLVTASLNQASHCIYYGFASLHWHNAGLGGGVIGGLWALGVLAEVLLFAASGRVVRWLGAERLVLIGVAAGIVRWSALAFTTDPVLLVPFQILHAATFGAAHLGAMHLIARRIDGRLIARAQALYSSVAMGLIPGVGLIAAGPIYAAFGGHAFLFAAVASIIGTWTGWRLLRQSIATQNTAEETPAA